jgi:iron complex outermembrane receptor protein
MDIRVDTFTQMSSFFSNNNGSITPATRPPGYIALTLRYGWNDIMQSRYSLAIYAKNLLDRVYYEAGYTEGAAGRFNTVIPAEPRTIGAELTATF